MVTCVQPGLLVLCAALTLALAACAPAARPRATYALDGVLLRVDFSAARDWQRYADAAGTVGVRDGVYRAESFAGALVWGLRTPELYSDVVIEAAVRDLSARRNNAFGIVCRADPSDNGSGYFFLLSGDGYAAIYRGAARDWTPLVDWEPRAGVIPTNGGRSVLRAVCAGDYLALWVDGTFVLDTRDGTYTRGGVALAAASLEDAPVTVEFDDVVVFAARPD